MVDVLALVLHPGKDVESLVAGRMSRKKVSHGCRPRKVVGLLCARNVVKGDGVRLLQVQGREKKAFAEATLFLGGVVPQEPPGLPDEGIQRLFPGFAGGLRRIAHTSIIARPKAQLNPYSKAITGISLWFQTLGKMRFKLGPEIL